MDEDQQQKQGPYGDWSLVTEVASDRTYSAAVTTRDISEEAARMADGIHRLNTDLADKFDPTAEEAAHLIHAEGLLRGVANGTISTGQPELGRCLAALAVAQVGRENPCHEFVYFEKMLRDCAALGLTAEGNPIGPERNISPGRGRA